MNEQFAYDVREGLNQKNKSLPSKYFYDDKGSALFSEIMTLPEYYLTAAEYEIFHEKSIELIKLLGMTFQTPFDLIELGAGDGYKTIELLKALDQEGYSYRYLPIDISKKALSQIEKNIKQQFPKKPIYPKQGDYFYILEQLRASTLPKVVLFLGSNMGNMTDAISHKFFKNLSQHLSPGDCLVLGVDLKKSKSIILPAYNDSRGLTKAFNLNLLHRINKELEANFNLDLFEHIPEYDEQAGIAKSYIVSTINQEVYIKGIDLKVSFRKNEKIHTEISRKYDDEIINKIFEGTSFKIIGKLTDSQGLFADFVLKK